MTRKIVIVDSASNRRPLTITTSAITLGDLKKDVIAAGVNIEGKDWMEGITQSIYVNDNAILPTEVVYKGKKTNNLIYMLTNTNKKIKSGLTRKEMVDIIKENSLEYYIKDTYGKNWTNCSNDILEKAIKDNSVVISKDNKSTEAKENTKDSSVKFNSLNESISLLKSKLIEINDIILNINNMISNNNDLNLNEINDIINIVNE